MRRLLLPVLFLVLALGLGGGCADARDTVTAGDRLVTHQILGAADYMLGRFEALEVEIADRPSALEVLEDLRTAAATVKLNAEHLEGVHGPPEVKETFSVEASRKARGQSTEEHSRRGFLGWLTLIGGYLAGAAAVAAGLLNAPVIGPWLATTKVGQVAARVLSGPIVKMGLDAVKTISVARSEAETKPLTAQDLVRLAVKTASPTSAAIADKVSNQLEAANKIAVTPIRELEVPAV